MTDSIIPDYVALTDETQKNAYLQKLYDSYFSPGNTHAGNVELKRGYFFFPEFHKRQINGRDFREAYRDAASPLYFQFPDRYKTEVAIARDILAHEYKVHLMPKTEYIPFILEQLFQAIKDDPELADAIAEIKVISQEQKIDTDELPGIVIYTQLGKVKAQQALNKIYEHLAKYDSIGSDKTPRYNKKVNHLIYYAQSGGDWKNDYINGATAVGRDITKDGIFDPDLVRLTYFDELWGIGVG